MRELLVTEEHKHTMKLTTKQPKLSPALATVARAVAGRTTLPVLANIMLTAENGDAQRLKVSATNLEWYLTATIDAEVAEAGAVTLPAKTLSDLVNTLPGGDVTLALNAKTQTAKVEGERIKANVKGIDAADFPDVPVMDRDSADVIDGPDLRRLLRAVMFATATDETRPILTGVYWRREGYVLKLAATDGFRVAEASFEMASDVAEPWSCVVPARAMGELVKIVDSMPVAFAFDTKRSRFFAAAGNVELCANVLDGAFPVYESIIPNKHKSKATIKTGDNPAVTLVNKLDYIEDVSTRKGIQLALQVAAGRLRKALATSLRKINDGANRSLRRRSG